MTPQDSAHVQRMREDFFYFTESLWNYLRLTRGHPLGDVDRDMCEFIAGGPRRRCVLAPRGYGKTHLVCSYVVWRIYRDRDVKIPIVSKSDKVAKETLHLIKDWLRQVPILQHLAPRKVSGDRDAATYFDAHGAEPSRTPTVSSAGLGGQLEGGRAHVLIADDVETDENTVTAEMRQTLAKRITEFGRMATYGDREIIYIGTPHHEESIYHHVLPQREVTVRTWTLVYPKPSEKQIGLAPMLQQRLDDGEAQPGDIVCPYRFDRQYVNEQRADGNTSFMMQNQLVADLGDQDRHPLRLRDLIVFDSLEPHQCPISIVWGTNNGQGQSTRIEDIQADGLGGDGCYGPVMFDKQWASYTGTKMWIDPAKGGGPSTSSGHSGDGTGFAIVSHGHGRLWLHDAGAYQGSATHDTLAELIQKARFYRCQEIHVEDFALQNFYASLLESMAPKYFLSPGQDQDHPDGWACSIVLTKPPGGNTVYKESRIIGALEPIMNMHRLVVARQVAENSQWRYQLTRITRQRGALAHEDALEATAMACWLWEDTLRLDPEESAEKAREQQIEEELEKWYADMGYPRKKPRWFTHQHEMLN